MFKKTRIFISVMLVFCPVTTQDLHAETAAKKLVLVLNSYHRGLSWTDRVVDGIDSVLKNSSDIELYYEYMDSKRFVGREQQNSLFYMME